MEWAAEYGHLWRTTSDIRPTWRSVMRLTDSKHGLAGFAGPGGWNDPDMLEVGNPVILAHSNGQIVDESGQPLAPTGARPVTVWSGRPVGVNEQLLELGPHEMVLVRSAGNAG
ncbi:hypothetical protein GCM10022381_07030 [Leifsonia kafniensis]|uniref:Alpha-galactosidase n=1 Tax=Leifsonia kafniensis TaxID=475957 RepID=A0ABP7K4U2_9MICO